MRFGPLRFRSDTRSKGNAAEKQNHFEWKNTAGNLPAGLILVIKKKKPNGNNSVNRRRIPGKGI
jgi:hypothetical protein